MADNFKIIDSKKYMWDHEDYQTEAAARENISTYSNDGFETKLIEEDGKYLVYTRRVVTEIVVEGEPV
ncbi:MAG: hypothetical protein JSV88_16000 [Candidatus Aminicenantes bacterium]|nr:MAG: hypothetical protein JSV88_16000 [Candidatus Aminicenantes bacterium]